MGRDYYINGESLVLVKGSANYVVNGQPFSTLQQLGLAAGPIRVTPNFRHRDINVDAWGSEVPTDVQFMLADVSISMMLIHFDRNVLDVCWASSMGGATLTAAGAPTMARAGTRLGAGFAAGTNPPPVGNNYLRLTITSPTGSPTKPWLFFSTYMTGPAAEFPLGTEKSMVQVNWRAIPYVVDPANIVAGVITGAQNYPIWDYLVDT